jgi:hypothetical protein
MNDYDKLVRSLYEHSLANDWAENWEKYSLMITLLDDQELTYALIALVAEGTLKGWAPPTDIDTAGVRWILDRANDVIVDLAATFPERFASMFHNEKSSELN